MADLNRLITGQQVKRFPAGTHNTLVDETLAARTAPADQPNDPPPERKSPVAVVLVWTGAAPIDPGQRVKLGAVLATPTDDASAPFCELRFLCSAYETGDDDSTPFAITLGPLHPGEAGHGFVPQAWWAKAYINDETHSFAKAPTATSTLMQSATSGLRIFWKETGVGEKWAVVQMLGAGEHFQLIRGLTTTAVGPTATAFQLDTLKEFEELARLPASPVWVAPPPGGTTLGLGDYVWAAYHKGYAVTVVDLVTITVDWVMIPTSSAASTPPLRRFQLTATKLSTSATATGKFIDDAGNMLGSTTTFYDPYGHFSGRAAGYLSGEQGFVGTALLRTDLATLQPDRWEIIDLEGFAEWALLQFAGSPINGWKPLLYGGIGNQWRRPQLDTAAVTLDDPLGLVAAALPGVEIVTVLVDPDTTPPTYQLRDVKQNSSQHKTLIRGRCRGAKSFDPFVYIDNITLEANSIDPRDVPAVGTIFGLKNISRESIAPNEWVTGVYNDTLNQWEVLAVERPRMLRGIPLAAVTPADSEFQVDHVEFLANSRDTRDVPGNADEAIWIQNILKLSFFDPNAPQTEFTTSPYVHAAFNAGTGKWEVLPAAGADGEDGASGTFVCVLSADISPTSPGSLTQGGATVYNVGENGILTELGPRTVFNPFTCKLPHAGAQYPCARTYLHKTGHGFTETPADDQFTITGADVIAVICALSGFGPATLLGLPDGASPLPGLLQFIGKVECDDGG